MATCSYHNKHTIGKIIASTEVIEGTTDPSSELDSHANMVVLGQNAFVFESTGRTCNVWPFTSDLDIVSNVPIVDGAIAYDCPQASQTYILISRNALYVPMMDNNLISPFIMRHGGVMLMTKPKYILFIHLKKTIVLCFQNVN